jgi:tryptophanyl-tRNA synthetase
MARDFAQRLNAILQQPVFVLPNAYEREAVDVPGTDGWTKMSKSRGNVIDSADEPDLIRHKIMRIATQCSAAGEQSSGTAALFRFAELCCRPEIFQSYVSKYKNGEGKFFGEMKRDVSDAIVRLCQPVKDRVTKLDDTYVDRMLRDGSKKVRELAYDTLCRARKAIGM